MRVGNLEGVSKIISFRTYIKITIRVGIGTWYQLRVTNVTDVWGLCPGISTGKSLLTPFSRTLPLLSCFLYSILSLNYSCGELILIHQTSGPTPRIPSPF